MLLLVVTEDLLGLATPEETTLTMVQHDGNQTNTFRKQCSDFKTDSDLYRVQLQHIGKTF